MPWNVARSALADVAEVDAEEAELAAADALDALFDSLVALALALDAGWWTNSLST